MLRASSPRSNNYLAYVFETLSNLSEKLSCPNIQQLPCSVESVNILIESIKHQIDSKDISLLNAFQSIIHLLDSCSLMSKVTKTNDKKLFEKAFSYFNQSLNHLVKTLHQYPINIQYLQKKVLLQKRHYLILQEAEQNSVQSSILQDNSCQGDSQKLTQQNQQLARRNQELQLVLATMEKEVVQTELRMMTLLNDQKEKSLGRIIDSPKSLVNDLQTARNQIKQMNKQFTTEIKYNEVFRSMEEEIRYLSSIGVDNDNEIIQQLETQIIKLREERERDDMIISELRQHLARYRGYYKNHNRASHYRRDH